MGDKLKKINLQAEGITCTGCATDMENILRNTDGILNALVDYSTGIINVEFNPDEIRTDDIVSIAKKLGIRTKAIDS